MMESLSKDYWLSLGGDLVVAGTDDSGQPWPVGIQNPFAHDHDFVKLIPPPGRWGVATSGTTKRHGVKDGVPWHHIIDPRTNKPSDSDVIAATVIAPEAVLADALAKVVLLRGTAEGLVWAAQDRNINALAISHEGKIFTTPDMKNLLMPV